jgi:hypothetical protein
MLVYKFYMNSIRRRPPNTSFAFASPALPSNCFLQADNSIHCLSSNGKIVGTGSSLAAAQADLKSKTTTHPSTMVTHHVPDRDKHTRIKHVTHTTTTTKVTPMHHPVTKNTSPLDQIGQTVDGIQKGLGSIGDTIFGVKHPPDKSADSNKIAPTKLKDLDITVVPSKTPAVTTKVTPMHPAITKKVSTPLTHTIVKPAPVSPFLKSALDQGKVLSKAPPTTVTAPTIDAPAAAAADDTAAPAPHSGLLGGNNMLLIGGIVVVGLVVVLLAVR